LISNQVAIKEWANQQLLNFDVDDRVCSLLHGFSCFCN